MFKIKGIKLKCLKSWDMLKSLVVPKIMGRKLLLSENYFIKLICSKVEISVFEVFWTKIMLKLLNKWISIINLKIINKVPLFHIKILCSFDNKIG